MKQQNLSFQTVIPHSYHLKYLLHLPDGYNQEAGRHWPVILFLHGAGERGQNLELVLKHGIPRIVEEMQDFPFITIAPQCPMDTWWSDHFPVLDVLLKEVVDRYDVDQNRIYVTGISMGGYGTWHLAATYPERFAAIAPICGGGPWFYGFPEKVRDLVKTPVWAFHGALDEIVPLRESQILVDELRAVGGDVRMTIYPDAGHDSWTQTYRNPELYNWFLSNRKQK